MKYRKFGQTGIKVSEIGLGTGQLANLDGKLQGEKQIPWNSARSIVKTALENGVNFFDTSDIYGNAEELLGEFTKYEKSDLVIATKTGLKLSGVQDFSKEYIIRSAEKSLIRLKLDQLSIFSVNKPSLEQLLQGDIYEAFDRLKKQGKILFCGVGVGDIEAGVHSVKSKEIDCIQVLYHLLYNEPTELIDLAGLHGKGVVVRSPLNSGILSGTYSKNTKFDTVDWRSRIFTSDLLEERLCILQEIQQELGWEREDVLDISLQYILSNDNVSSITPGASNASQVNQYVSNSGKKVSKTEVEGVSRILARVSDRKGKHSYQN